jgi:phosphoserine phosphatase
MTSIYLVRHGQTAWNKEDIFRGRSNIPLDETGLKQAAAAAEYFREIEIHSIYSSPMSRAWQTAEKIGEVRRLPVEPLEGITDMSFGDWEGKSVLEVEKKDGEKFRQWKEEPHRLQLPGGESLDIVRARAMGALSEVIDRHPGKTLALVTHRVINKVILCGILGLDNSHFWQIDQSPTAINLIRYREGKYFLSLMNETCHLKTLKR